jgi:phosphoribosylanthranilate isomerase
MARSLGNRPVSNVFSSPRIKICGIRTVEHAQVAAAAGADAIGLVFFAASPRHVDVATAKAIVAALPPFVTVVGLFVNESAAVIQEVAKDVGLDLIQYSGDETPEHVAAVGLPYIKTLRFEGVERLLNYAAQYREARGILLDASVPGAWGGTGVTLDWQAIGQARWPFPLVLAGGLTPANVGQAIRQTRPWAVDVSSGVESARGQKHSDLIRTFIANVHAAATTP